MSANSNSVYLPIGLDGYELCAPTRPQDFERLNREIDGRPRAESWNPIIVKVIAQEGGVPLQRSDAPWLGSHALILGEAAVEIMHPLISANCELLPLTCRDRKLVVCNASLAAEALDEQASTATRFDDGRIMMIDKYVFRGDQVRKADIFKIPNLRVSPTFVGDRFVERWAAAGLSGLAFKKVWGI